MKLKLLKLVRFFHLISKRDYNEKRQIEIVKKSPLFDRKWYLSQNPDVKAKKMGAAKHYVKYGWKEGRNPSPEFDGNAYLQEFPKLREKNWCPLFHYMLEHPNYEKHKNKDKKKNENYQKITDWNENKKYHCNNGKLEKTNRKGVKLLQPSFSIIMPTYNRDFCICNAVNSILKQTYHNYELIIVDDGSTDKTKELIYKEYDNEINNGKIKYISKENSGVCKTRNVGLDYAKNEWIAYLDSDNDVTKDFLETFAIAINLHKKTKLFYAKLICNNSKKILGKKFNRESLLQQNFIDLGTFIHHKSILKEKGKFDENMTRLVDWELIARYTKDFKPIYIDHIVLNYNDSNEHSRITNSSNYYENLYYFRKKHCSHYFKTIITTMITCYNHEKYISQAIDSAIKQTGKFIHEIIISDDGSTDKTPQIIQEYAEKYPSLIRNISQTNNVGISANMKRCFKEAKGKYIAVLEGDDYWISSYKLEKQKNFLEKNKDCTMVFSRIKLQNRRNKIELLKRQEHIPSKVTENFFIKDNNIDIIANFSCCMFRCNYMKNLPKLLYKNRLSEIALAFYLMNKGKIGFIKEPLSVYRQHENGVWSGADASKKLESGIKCMIATMLICRKKYKQYIKKRIENKKDELRRLNTMHMNKYRKELETWYKRVMKQELNLDNPKTYNEKMQWLKLYDSTPLKTRLADKYLVRDWVKETIGEEYLIPLLGVYDKFDDIDFSKLPNKFVMKCNHGSGWNIIVTDKSKLDIQGTKTKIDRWMNDNYAFKAGCELHYRDIEPKIIIEEYIDPTISNYKIQAWVFNNEIKFISVETIKDANNLERGTFYPDGTRTEFEVSPTHYKRLEKTVSPEIFNKVINTAKKMIANVPYVRIDFIEYKGIIKFREMTFTSGSGLSQIEPKEAVIKLGNWIKLPKLTYNIDTGEYYKLPKPQKKVETKRKPSIIKSYLLFPYYLLKIRSMKRKLGKLPPSRLFSISKYGNKKVYRILGLKFAFNNFRKDVLDNQEKILKMLSDISTRQKKLEKEINKLKN